MRRLNAGLLMACVAADCGSAGADRGARSTPDGGPADAGESDAGSVSVQTDDSSSGSQPPPSTCVTAAQLESWQQQIDALDGGYRPTGSPAHEQYIELLSKELTAAGVEQVHTEPYAFEKWTPASWSLSLLSGPSSTPVQVSAFVPYSGTTGAAGVQAPIAYVPGSTIPIDANALAGALQNPTAWTQSLTASLEAALAAAGVALAGRIVVFDLPKLALSLQTLTGTTIAVNDPGHTLSMTATITRDDLSAMLVMPAMLTALASSGALAAVGILDAPEEAARGEMAPFFGTLSPNMPALYVDRDTGAALRAAVATTPAARLVLDANVAPAQDENLVGILPGAATEEILVGSHTDGPNAMEDNGPVGILGLVQCLAPLGPAGRPRTIRVVLSGGHFAGSRGLQTYVAAHTADLTAHALAVMEIEHLGAREWTEISPGQMGLTGLPETQVLYTSTPAPLVAASKAFAAEFPRTVVGTPPILGEGQNFRILPLVQFITMPEYLLLANLPVTQQLTDFDAMQRQVLAFVAMEQALAVAPASQLGVGK